MGGGRGRSFDGEEDEADFPGSGWGDVKGVENFGEDGEVTAEGVGVVARERRREGRVRGGMTMRWRQRVQSIFGGLSGRM